MPTHTVAATSTTPEALSAIDEFVRSLPEGEARDAIEAAASTLRSGRDVIVAGADDAVTPNQAAKVLGVSRAHFYKILDAGTLRYSIVGTRDRRIAMSDLQDYIAKAEELRRASAGEDARSRTTRANALDEM